METSTVTNIETGETATIPTADLQWFLENGWSEGETQSKSKSKSK